MLSSWSALRLPSASKLSLENTAGRSRSRPSKSAVLGALLGRDATGGGSPSIRTSSEAPRLQLELLVHLVVARERRSKNVSARAQWRQSEASRVVGLGARNDNRGPQNLDGNPPQGRAGASLPDQPSSVASDDWGLPGRAIPRKQTIRQTLPRRISILPIIVVSWRQRERFAGSDDGGGGEARRFRLSPRMPRFQPRARAIEGLHRAKRRFQAAASLRRTGGYGKRLFRFSVVRARGGEGRCRARPMVVAVMGGATIGSCPPGTKTRFVLQRSSEERQSARAGST